MYNQYEYASRLVTIQTQSEKCVRYLLSAVDIFLFSRLLSENKISSVNRALFRGLNNLQSLSLYGNMISCVTPGAFDELTR